MNETNVYSTILGGCWLVMTTTTGWILGNLPLEDGITINILNPIIPNPQVWAGCQFGCFPLNNIVVGHVDKNAIEMIMWSRFRQRGSGYWLWHMSSLESMVTKHWNSIDWELGGVRGSRRVGGIVCRLCESVPPDEPAKLSKDLFFLFFQQVNAGMIWPSSVY